MHEPQRISSRAPWPRAFSEEFQSQVTSALNRVPSVLLVGPRGSGLTALALAAAEGRGPAAVAPMTDVSVVKQKYGRIQPFIDTPLATADATPEEVAALLVETTYPALVNPLTLVIPAADLCDSHSAQVMTILLRNPILKVIATVTPDAEGAVKRWGSRRERIGLPPLDVETINRLLIVRFGQPAHPSALNHLLAVTGGSYGVLKDVADAAASTGMLVSVGGMIVADESRVAETTAAGATQFIEHKLARFSSRPDVLDLLRVTAILGKVDADEAEDLFGDAVSTAVQHGGLRQIDGALGFPSPAERHVLSHQIDAQRRPHLFAAYAPGLTRSMRAPGAAVAGADWHLSAGVSIPPDLAAQAAREANIAGQYDKTLRFTDPAPGRPEYSIAPVERGMALGASGRSFDLAESMTMVQPELLSEEEMLLYLRQILRMPAGAQRDGLLERTAAGDAAGPERHAQLVLLAELCERALNEAGRDLAGKLLSMTFGGQLSPLNHAQALTTLAMVQLHSGDPAQAIKTTENARSILANHPSTVTAYQLATCRAVYLRALMWSLEFSRAAEVLSTPLLGAGAPSDPNRSDLALAVHLDAHRGQFAQAVASGLAALDLLRATDPHRWRGWIQSMVAHLLALTGRADEARGMLDTSFQHVPISRQIDLERRLSQAGTLDVLGEPEEALEILEGIIADAKAHDLHLVGAEAAVMAVQVEGPHRVGALMEALERIPHPTGSPLLWKAVGEALAASDASALLTIVKDLNAREANFYAAEIASFALQSIPEDSLKRAGALTTLKQFVGTSLPPHA